VLRKNERRKRSGGAGSAGKKGRWHAEEWGGVVMRSGGWCRTLWGGIHREYADRA
jgi:hypothetical protein